MQNITPEDRQKWDKAMADHQKRLRKKPSTLRGIAIAICAIIVAGIIIALVKAHYFPSPETRDPEIILNDTLQMNAGDISRDSALRLMKQSPCGREYDSTIKAQEAVDSAYKGRAGQ